MANYHDYMALGNGTLHSVGDGGDLEATEYNSSIASHFEIALRISAGIERISG